LRNQGKSPRLSETARDGNLILTLAAEAGGMASPWAAQASLPIERRVSGRARADCEARLQTPGGDWRGRLWDLSETGARVQVANPPAEGVLALLKWNASEVFCRVVWSADDMCGVVFERPLAGSVVAETVGHEVAVDRGPAASVGSIPVGQRRSRLRSVDDA
jgi:hypothetical protein